MSDQSIETVLNFWFDEIEPAQWWQKDQKFDDLIERRFADLHAQAAACELYAWRASADGCLAEVIVLDQFSRNMFRDSAQAFGYDALALSLAQNAVAAGLDQQLSPTQRNFLYMPYMHSESAKIHEVAEQLFSANSETDNIDFELRHKDIIDRFGRYPHRNEILGRESSAAEVEFLSKPGSSF